MFVKRPKGTRDFYGPEQLVKKTVEQVLAQLAEQHGFSEIETPVFEHAQVFTKSIGSDTDIVGKEMYQFNDRKNRPLVLRPEATASVVRAWVEDKLYLKSDYHRLYYSGPMFRYENPQRGRYRQFHQFGVEYLAPKDPCADLEIILLAESIVRRFGLKTKLVVNSLGDAESRASYVKALRAYFQNHRASLNGHSQRRLESNVLRILDDKTERGKKVVQSAPQIADYYTPSARNYWQRFCNLLDQMDIKYQVDPYLVRGLDYYNDIIFEYLPVNSSQGSQNTVIAGGRYDNLLAQAGGPDHSSVGFSLGVERLIAHLPTKVSQAISPEPAFHVVNFSSAGCLYGLKIADQMRQQGFKTELWTTPDRLSKTLAKVAKKNPRAIIIIGDQEVKTNTYVLKASWEQKSLTQAELIEQLKTRFNDGGPKNEKN